LKTAYQDMGVERDNALVAYNNLKCCGNCYNFYQGTKCPHNYQAVNNICNNYDCDNLTRKERET
jgi:hypothetical protein